MCMFMFFLSLLMLHGKCDVVNWDKGQTRSKGVSASIPKACVNGGWVVGS